MNQESYNPGMSEKAWKDYTKLIARLNIKYQDKIMELQEKQSNKGA